MLRIGITEAGDAGRHLEWTAAMDSVHAAILITKAPTGEFLEAVKRFRARVMLHVTVTGYGGSLIEPGAPPPRGRASSTTRPRRSSRRSRSFFGWTRSFPHAVDW
jgi:hypothetical protein